jgi:hypothetical protein
LGGNLTRRSFDDSLGVCLGLRHQEKDMHDEGRLVVLPRAAGQLLSFGWWDEIGTIASLSGRMKKHQPSAEDRVPARRLRTE